jgi:hypothetical protein
MSEGQLSQRLSIRNQQALKNRLSVRKMTVKNQGNSVAFVPASATQVVHQKPKISDLHYFLVTTDMRSRIKKLMSDTSDAFVRDQVVFTTFIGNREEDDILVVLKNGRYLVFDNSGRVVRLEATFKFMEVSPKGKVTSRFYNEDDLKNYTIVDTLNVMNNDENSTIDETIIKTPRPQPHTICGYLKLLMLNTESGEYFTAMLK